MRLSTKVCSPCNRQNGTEAQDEGLCYYLPACNADPSSAFPANTSKLKIEMFPSQLACRKNPSLGSGAITKFYWEHLSFAGLEQHWQSSSSDVRASPRRVGPEPTGPARSESTN